MNWSHVLGAAFLGGVIGWAFCWLVAGRNGELAVQADLEKSTATSAMLGKPLPAEAQKFETSSSVSLPDEEDSASFYYPPTEPALETLSDIPASRDFAPIEAKPSSKVSSYPTGKEAASPKSALVVATPLEPKAESKVWKPREFTTEELEKIGKRVWQSECSGTVDGLTSWNKGEAFASVGIGHFLWFPAGSDAIFDESFPTLLDFMESKGKGDSIPDWIRNSRNEQGWPDCPWNTRTEFMNDFRGQQMTNLRGFLKSTVPTQAEFLVLRFHGALDKLLPYAGNQAPTIERRFKTLAETPEGAFAMIDYVNFKGEGTKEEERYQGEGWGLLQVLGDMDDELMQKNGPAQEFSAAAERTLTRRTVNNPPDKKWLKGWTNRVRSYRQPF